jgi:alginate biosynthesis protein AlgX
MKTKLRLLLSAFNSGNRIPNAHQQGLLMEKFNDAAARDRAEALKAGNIGAGGDCFTKIFKQFGISFSRRVVQTSIVPTGVLQRVTVSVRTYIRRMTDTRTLQLLDSHSHPLTTHLRPEYGVERDLIPGRPKTVAPHFLKLREFSAAIVVLTSFSIVKTRKLQNLNKFLFASAVPLMLMMPVFKGHANPPAKAQARPVSHQTDSAAGCPASITRAGSRYVKGDNGVFFRLFPDLDMYFPLDADVAARLGKIADLLRAKGTNLVMLPIPARGTVMGRHLASVPVNLTYAFNPEIAGASYNGFVATLKNVGITTLNLLPVLKSRDERTDYFLPSDHHWNPEGAKTTAAALAKLLEDSGIISDLERTEFATSAAGVRMLPSTMRREIQVFCTNAIVPNNIAMTETIAADSGAAGDAADLFGDSDAGTQIVLTGTSFSDVEEFNFAGMISQNTGLNVTNFAVSGGNQFVSILSYMTSPEFEEQRPRVLIWENPVYNNFGAEGEAPLDELLAAASGTCEPGIAESLTGSPANGGMVFEVPAQWQQNVGNTYVRVDVGDRSERAVEIIMQAADGTSTVKKITRPNRFKANGVFFAKINDSNLKQLTIKANRLDQNEAAITLCVVK